MNDKETINVAVDGLMGIATATISLLRPTLSIPAMAIQPALALHLKKFLHKLVEQEKITPRECSRMEKGIDGMVDTIQEYSQSTNIRTDDILQPDADGFSKADDLFESMINHIKQDSESRKAWFYGNFVGSIPFSSDLSYSNLTQYAKIISQLTYTELCLLNNFCRNYKDKSVDFGKAELYVKQTEDPNASELLSEIIHMRNLCLLNSHPPYNQGEIIGKVSLSFSGERLYKLMRLNLLNSKDTNKTLGDLWRITKYLS